MAQKTGLVVTFDTNNFKEMFLLSETSKTSRKICNCLYCADNVVFDLRHYIYESLSQKLKNCFNLIETQPQTYAINHITASSLDAGADPEGMEGWKGCIHPTSHCQQCCW